MHHYSIMRRLVRFQIIAVISTRRPLDLRPQPAHLSPHRRQIVVQLAHHAVQLADKLFEVRNLLFNTGESIVHAGIIEA